MPFHVRLMLLFYYRQKLLKAQIECHMLQKWDRNRLDIAEVHQAWLQQMTEPVVQLCTL